MRDQHVKLRYQEHQVRIFQDQVTGIDLLCNVGSQSTVSFFTNHDSHRRSIGTDPFPHEIDDVEFLIREFGNRPNDHGQHNHSEYPTESDTGELSCYTTPEPFFLYASLPARSSPFEHTCSANDLSRLADHR